MLANKNKIPTTFRGRYAFWRMIYIVIFLLLLGAMGMTYYFIYQNIYSTIANTNIVSALKSNANIYNLDVAGFQKATAAIEKKQKIEYVDPNSKNIFNYSPNPVTSTPLISTSTYVTSTEL
jgi:hypothetical protein